MEIYDSFFTEDGNFVIVSELGKTDLRKFIESWMKDNAVQLELDEIIEIFLPLLNALEFIHQSNIIHRDISPDNVI